MCAAGDPESWEACSFALVAMLGPLGLRIFEATGADIADLVRSTAAGSCGCGKGTKIVLVPLPPAVGQSGHRPCRRLQGPRVDPADTGRLYLYASTSIKKPRHFQRTGRRTMIVASSGQIITETGHDHESAGDDRLA